MKYTESENQVFNDIYESGKKLDFQSFRNVASLIYKLHEDFQEEHWENLKKYFTDWGWEAIWKTNGSTRELAKVFNTYNKNGKIPADKMIFNPEEIFKMAIHEALTLPFADRSGLPLELFSALGAHIINGMESFSHLSEKAIKAYINAIMKIDTKDLYEVHSLREYLFTK